MKWMYAKPAAALVLLLPLVLAGCGGGDDNGPTNPGPGGGGTTFASPTLPPSATFAHTFNTNGTFGYHCGIHPTIMTGARIVVSDTSAVSVAVSIVSLSTPGFSPATAWVKKGGTVTWTNNHSMNHSVEND